MNRLKEARKAKKMTQAQVAKYMNMAQASYSLWESGRNKIDAESLSKLAALFDVSTDYLLGLTDNKKPPVSEDNKRSVPAGTSEETKRAMELLYRLNPENFDKAIDHLQYLLARQEESEDKK